MYFGRLEKSETEGRKTLPTEWLEEFTTTLNEAYHEQAKTDKRFFETYGEIYQDEFVVITSYIDNKDPMKSPISIFLSHDNQEESKQFKKTLDELINLVGLILDDIFMTPNWSEYNSNWTENNYKGSIFHYKITRENVSLTLQAEALLNKDIELH